MYQFIDVTGQQPAAQRPAEAMQVNGVYLEDLIPGYRTLYVRGRENLTADITALEMEVRDGARYRRRRHLPRTLTIGYQLIAASNAAFRAAYNQLLYALDQEEMQLIFEDESDKYFTGTKVSFSDVPAGTNAVTGEIEIYCADPFKYSVQEYEVTTESSADGPVFLINYDGTQPAAPVLEATIPGECGFVGYVNQDGAVLQIGDPGDVEEETVQQTSRLVHDEFHSTSLAGWTRNNAALVYDTAGQTGSPKYLDWSPPGSSGTWSVVAVNSQGTTNAEPWHGYGMSRSVTASDKCTYTFVPIFYYSSVKELGFLEFSMNAASGRGKQSIAAVIYSRNSVGSADGMIRLYVNGELMETISTSFKKDNPYTGIRPGIHPVYASITKFGNVFTFELGGCTKTYTVPGTENLTVADISFFAGYYKTAAHISAMYVDYVRFDKHVVETYVEIPNKFTLNDVVRADCRTGDVAVNNTIQHGLGALGNDWETFRLVPGANQILCTWSEWSASAPEFRLKYRKVYQ